MIDKKIKSKINKRLNQGDSKSYIYDQFKDELKDESLRKYLASRPPYDLRLKFKKMHLILSIIWGFFLLFELVGILDLIVSFDIKYFISLIISIYITINIWKFDGRFFLPGIIWFVFTIFNTFRELNSVYKYDYDYNIMLIIALVYSLILIVGIYLLYRIKKNVFSYFKWFQPILNRDNEVQFER